MTDRIRPLCTTAVLAFSLALFPTAICVTPLYGAEPSTGAERTAAEEEAPDTSVGKQQRWAAFPVISSSPETGLVLGGMLFHFFPIDRPGAQASTLDLIAYGTTEGQYALAVTPNVFFGDGSYRVNTSFFANFWPANFYPIGNDSPDDDEEYESTSYGANLILEGRYFDSFIVNVGGRYEHVDMEVEEGGMLASGTVHGADDGEYVCGGIALGYDTRDNTNSPTRGSLARYEYLAYDEDIGSSLDFSVQTLDLRYYQSVPMVQGSVLAFAAQVKSSSGDVPFRYLPTPDGTNILRGIENGRYKDHQMVSLQSEFRFPLWKRLSGTVFAEFAQVADEFGDMELGETKTSIGSGIRYALNSEQRFNVRADLSWVDGGPGMIINIREAF